MTDDEADRKVEGGASDAVTVDAVAVADGWENDAEEVGL